MGEFSCWMGRRKLLYVLLGFMLTLMGVLVALWLAHFIYPAVNADHMPVKANHVDDINSITRTKYIKEWLGWLYYWRVSFAWFLVYTWINLWFTVIETKPRLVRWAFILMGILVTYYFLPWLTSDLLSFWLYLTFFNG